MKFAWMITNSTKNIGDDFQCLAAKQFIDKYDVEVEIDRENLKDYCENEVKMIMNGWYVHNPKVWPPSKQIKPLLVSMHFSNHKQKNGLVPIDFILNKEGKEYLENNGPIGCRDIYTYKLLKKKNIPCYFSGCLTTTLPHTNNEKQEYICLVDMDDDIYNFFKKRTNRRIIRIDHEQDWGDNYEKRLEKANELINLYQHAHLVVTNRLHAALPNLAFGTPVLLIHGKYGDERFTGLKELTNYCTKEELISGRYPLNIENPLSNPDEYKTIRKNNKHICSMFAEGKEDTLDYEKISKENLAAVRKASERTAQFRKNNKLTSYRRLQMMYFIRHNIRNLQNLLNK